MKTETEYKRFIELPETAIRNIVFESLSRDLRDKFLLTEIVKMKDSFVLKLEKRLVIK